MQGNPVEIRGEIGRVLRELRQREQLSLDDVEQLTRVRGVRVTRSHLSRVETGQADIALSRFLSLASALGRAPSDAAEQVASALDDESAGREPLERAVLRAYRRGDAAQALSCLQAARHRSAPLPPRQECQLGELAARVGHWEEAAGAFLGALTPARDDAAIASAAACALAAQRRGLALALVAGLEDGPPRSLLVALLELAGGGEPERVQRELSNWANRRELAAGWRTLAALLSAEAYRRTRQRRTAITLLERALSETSAPLLRAELERMLARLFGDLRRPAHGLKHLARARAAARQLGVPDLLIAVHLESKRLHEQNGDDAAAGSAGRAARALRLRYGADKGAPRHLPLHGLIAALAVPAAQKGTAAG